MGVYICNDCGEMFEFDGETSVGACPKCFSKDIVYSRDYDRCPTCDGFKHTRRCVCDKCREKNVIALKKFVAQFNDATLDDMDNLLEGCSLFDFR